MSLFTTLQPPSSRVRSTSARAMRCSRGGPGGWVASGLQSTIASLALGAAMRENSRKADAWSSISCQTAERNIRSHDASASRLPSPRPPPVPRFSEHRRCASLPRITSSSSAEGSTAYTFPGATRRADRQRKVATPGADVGHIQHSANSSGIQNRIHRKLLAAIRGFQFVQALGVEAAFVAHARSVCLSAHQIGFAGIVQNGARVGQIFVPHLQRDPSGHSVIDAAADPAEVFVGAKALDSRRLQPSSRKQKLLFHQELSHHHQLGI